MIEAHEKKSGDTGGGQKGADMNQKGDDLNREIKSCQINNGDVKAKNEASATKVSVGIYVVQVDQLHRRELKKDAAKGHSACFLVDFVLVLTEPEGSTMITDAVWDTLSFRNAEEIYSPRSLQGVPNTRRIQVFELPISYSFLSVAGILCTLSVNSDIRLQLSGCILLHSRSSHVPCRPTGIENRSSADEVFDRPMVWEY